MRIERIDNPPTDEDFAEHQRTFAFFVRLVSIAVLHVLACLVAVAIGGIFGYWRLAFTIGIIATIAAAMGASNGRLGWRPGAAVLALSLVTLAAAS
jgi:hypothetical protein